MKPKQQEIDPMTTTPFPTRKFCSTVRSLYAEAIENGWPEAQEFEAAIDHVERHGCPPADTALEPAPEAREIIQLHPALAGVLSELCTQITAELEAMASREPTPGEVKRRITALAGPDRVSAMLDCAAMFGALYAAGREMERQNAKGDLH